MPPLKINPLSLPPYNELSREFFLKYLTMNSLLIKIPTELHAQKYMELFNLIPSRDELPLPVLGCCGNDVNCYWLNVSKRKLGWEYRCKQCRKPLNPLDKTIFENTNLKFQKILHLILAFV
jgi:hypothetical protein